MAKANPATPARHTIPTSSSPGSPANTTRCRSIAPTSPSSLSKCSSCGLRRTPMPHRGCLGHPLSPCLLVPCPLVPLFSCLLVPLRPSPPPRLPVHIHRQQQHQRI